MTSVAGNPNHSLPLVFSRSSWNKSIFLKCPNKWSFKYIELVLRLLKIPSYLCNSLTRISPMRFSSRFSVKKTTEFKTISYGAGCWHRHSLIESECIASRPNIPVQSILQHKFRLRKPCQEYDWWTTSGLSRGIAGDPVSYGHHVWFFKCVPVIVLCLIYLVHLLLLSNRESFEAEFLLHCICIEVLIAGLLVHCELEKIRSGFLRLVC